MRKILTYAVSALALASCSSDSLVSDSPANTQAPIAFNVGKKNITRTALEEAKHYNFGVWAYKTDGSTSQLVMDNYLVGYSNGSNLGYYKKNASTWNGSAGNDEDHKSPWFYEKLGKKEYTYTGTDGFYKNDTGDAAFMSANDYQYLRYWDLAYTNTNFYAYAPYKSSGVSFKDGKIAVDKEANVAGYNDASKHDFIYAGAQAANADKKDVTLTFKHLGALVKVAFRENVNGYKVQLIDVTTDGSGIQATTAKKDGTTYIHSSGTTDVTYVTYLTSCKATIDYTNSITTPSVTPVTDASSDVETSHENLKFTVPTSVKDHGLVAYPKTNSKYNVLPDVNDESYNSEYAVSPTTYYAVVQPSDSETGFTFHISYNLIAEDNGEVVTVRDARVHVPYTQVRWQSNTSYTYNFTISQVSSGTTKPNDPKIDLSDPTVPVGTVVPIVFDGATIENYTPNTPNGDIEI